MELLNSAIRMHFNEVDLLYQAVLKYQHHDENYMESLAEDITSNGLQLKKKVAFSSISSAIGGTFS